MMKMPFPIGIAFISIIFKLLNNFDFKSIVVGLGTDLDDAKRAFLSH